MPQQVANGVVMRQKYRDKQGVKCLSETGDSVPPSWLLILEHRIANVELENVIKTAVSTYLWILLKNDSFFLLQVIVISGKILSVEKMHHMLQQYPFTREKSLLMCVVQI